MDIDLHDVDHECLVATSNQPGSQAAQPAAQGPNPPFPRGPKYSSGNPNKKDGTSGQNPGYRRNRRQQDSEWHQMGQATQYAPP